MEEDLRIREFLDCYLVPLLSTSSPAYLRILLPSWFSSLSPCKSLRDFGLAFFDTSRADLVFHCGLPVAAGPEVDEASPPSPASDRPAWSPEASSPSPPAGLERSPSSRLGRGLETGVGKCQVRVPPPSASAPWWCGDRRSVITETALTFCDQVREGCTAPGRLWQPPVSPSVSGGSEARRSREDPTDPAL